MLSTRKFNGVSRTVKANPFSPQFSYSVKFGDKSLQSYVMFPSHSRRVSLRKALKTYLHDFLFLPRHTTFHPPSRMFYQLSVSPNDKATLFTRIQFYKLTNGIKFSFAMHYQFNYWIFYKWDTCSMSSGMLFHIIWNIVPSYLEHPSILATTRHLP